MFIWAENIKEYWSQSFILNHIFMHLTYLLQIAFKLP